MRFETERTSTNAFSVNLGSIASRCMPLDCQSNGYILVRIALPLARVSKIRHRYRKNQSAVVSVRRTASENHTAVSLNAHEHWGFKGDFCERIEIDTIRHFPMQSWRNLRKS